MILVQEKFAQLKEEELIFTTKPKENLTTKAPLIFNSCILTLNNDGSMDLRQNRQGKKLEIVLIITKEDGDEEQK